MKRRNIPLILMLVAGAVTGIITCVKGYSIVEKLTEYNVLKDIPDTNQVSLFDLA